MLNINNASINELSKFGKEYFDKDAIFSTAEELKYVSLAKSVFSAELENPSDSFIRFVINTIYDGPKTQKVIDKFTPIIKKAFTGFVNDTVNQKISFALTKDDRADAPIQPSIAEKEDEVTIPISKIITTQEELEAFYIVRSILSEIVPVEDITYRDAEGYFSILYKNNNRKPICRMNFDTKIKQLLVPDDNKKFERYYIETLSELYKHKELIITSLNRYLV